MSADSIGKDVVITMRKTGVIWIGHPDYLSDNLTAIQKEICESIKDIPFLELGDTLLAMK